MEEKNVNTLPHLSTDVPTRFMMLLPLGDLPISGGWGYSREDAVVIETDDPMEGVSLEYKFIEQRTRFEVCELEDEYYLEHYERERQALVFHDEVPYDIITYKVTIGNFEDDSTTEHIVQCWFNIAQFFGKYCKYDD